MDIRTGRQEPVVSAILPYTKTKGEEAVSLYNKTEKTMLDWQAALTYDIMAVDDEDLWLHQKFGYAVPRRNGKSELMLARCLYGLKAGEKILYTAHRTTTSHSIWERLERLCKKAGIHVTSSYKAMGKEHLYVDSGGKIEFRTRTSTGGLGEGYDLLIIDEAQEYTPEQETALKYVVSDSLNPQTIMLGTPPTAISAGTVFPKYREKVIHGGAYESGWAEWSVPDMTDVNDIDAWYETNPSLGTILTERKIRAEIGEDNIDFNIQRLGHWLKYNQKSAISATEWDALEVKELPKLVGGLFAGIKFGHDTSNVTLSIAVRMDDGKVFIEAIDCRPAREGVQWLVDFLKNPAVKQIAVDGDSGKGILEEAMRHVHAKKPIIVRTPDFIMANALFEQAIEAGTVRHMEQASLAQVVSNCEKRSIGNNGGFGYDSQLKGADVALLDSVILAHWLCVEYKGERKQTIRY